MKIDFLEADLGKKETIIKVCQKGDVINIFNDIENKVVLITLNDEVLYRSDKPLVNKVGTDAHYPKHTIESLEVRDENGIIVAKLNKS